MQKIVIVGCGNVGIAFANSLVNQHTKIDELILIDLDKKKALGHAMDLSHTLIYSKSKINIKVGSFVDCSDAKIVVITAGAKQKSNESRLELTSINKKIIKDITEKVVASGFKGIFVVATNPVDIMTYLVKKYSNFNTSKVIGTGTIIDTARCKYLLEEKLDVNSKDIELFVLGEHGDSLVIPWSSARVGSLNINDILVKSDLKQIENKVKKIGYKIIDLKGETSLAISICISRIINAILNDEYSILPVSVPYEGVYMGMPAVINKNGIKGVMKIKLTNEEAMKLEDSKEILMQTIEDLEE